jgi:mRNA-degrading endonuclease RelE of RelBE toxin-antitoxin system
MDGVFRAVTTPSFEREFRKVSRRNSKLLEALEELIALLAKDPLSHSGQHPIKKLEGVKPGEGQWHVRWGEYRLRTISLDARLSSTPSGTGKTPTS